MLMVTGLYKGLSCFGSKVWGRECMDKQKTYGFYKHFHTFRDRPIPRIVTWDWIPAPTRRRESTRAATRRRNSFSEPKMTAKYSTSVTQRRQRDIRRRVWEPGAGRRRRVGRSEIPTLHIHIRVHTYVYIHIRVHTHTCTHTYMFIHVPVHIEIPLHVRVYMHI